MFLRDHEFNPVQSIYFSGAEKMETRSSLSKATQDLFYVAGGLATAKLE